MTKYLHFINEGTEAQKKMFLNSWESSQNYSLGRLPVLYQGNKLEQQKSGELFYQLGTRKPLATE